MSCTTSGSRTASRSARRTIRGSASATLWHEQLLAFERGDRLVERRRHEQFAQHRILRTEWFESHPELDAHIAELAAGVDDPWSQYARWVSRAIALRG